MGTWGTGIFDNDEAQDWVASLKDDDNHTVAALLTAVAEETSYIEAPEAQRALAGAELVAALRGHPAANLPEDLVAWLSDQPSQVQQVDTTTAVEAVQRIRSQSELRELWEGQDAEAWVAAVDDLMDRLRRPSSTRGLSTTAAAQKRQRWTEGAIVAIPLANGHVAYAQLLREPEIAVFADRSLDRKTAEEVDRSNVIFRIWVMLDPIRKGRWQKVGRAPIDAPLKKAVPRCKRDPISGRLSIYISDGSGYHERPATADECRNLETAAVWIEHHVQDRLIDHFEGRPNKWVESLRVEKDAV